MRRKKLAVGLALLGLAAIAAGVVFRGELWRLVDRLLTSEVEIRIETSPENARVFLDGAEILSNPIQLRRSSQRFTIRIEAPGHRSRSLTIMPDASRSYRVVLVPLLRPRRALRAASKATPRPAVERCPPGMQLIPAELPTCIDRHEHPGRWRIPSHGVSLAEARRRCHARGARLCSADEWLRACGRRFPYGDRYRGDRCNTGGGTLLASGSKPGCRSALGVHDQSGNASEWVEDGVALGGDAGGSEDAVSCAASSESGTPLTGFRCCADPPWE